MNNFIRMIGNPFSLNEIEITLSDVFTINDAITDVY